MKCLFNTESIYIDSSLVRHVSTITRISEEEILEGLASQSTLIYKMAEEMILYIDAVLHF